MELSLDALDECIRAVNEVRGKAITRIYLNPDDWRQATSRLEALTGRVVARDSAFGIQVTLSSSLRHGMFVLEYDTLIGSQLVGWQVK